MISKSWREALIIGAVAFLITIAGSLFIGFIVPVSYSVFLSFIWGIIVGSGGMMVFLARN